MPDARAGSSSYDYAETAADIAASLEGTPLEARLTLPEQTEAVMDVIDALRRLPVEQRMEAMGMVRCSLDDVHEALDCDRPLWREF